MYVYATPNKRPINDVASMASTPQTTTRVVAGIIGAPPKRADTTPSNINPNKVIDANDQTSDCAGSIKIPRIGSIAPAMNDKPDAIEA